MKTDLILPSRTKKPRENGLTILIDNGVPLQLFKDSIKSAHPYIDFVKFGWGTSIVTDCLHEKIAWLGEHTVDFFFGGTLFEKFLSQGKIDSFYDFCKRSSCKYVEISNGTLSITNKEKSTFIKQFSREFIVFSEVGKKENSSSEEQDSSSWLDSIEEDFEAGASKVILEARESGTSGICQIDGNIRRDIFDFIIEEKIPINKLLFEAPTKKLQTFFIKKLGADVNLANIAFQNIISLETLRLGLRADTFNVFLMEDIK
ncbi:phosphosulfolactate synthase [Pseudogracilibacillus sp. SE30717A]|uniref:phosphosulfolactate synthase n=1 Tax=Pseudogracilibacillus sp. SE30717A TaxID=3098293 RepID=UPI00300E05ED